VLLVTRNFKHYQIVLSQERKH